GKAQRLDFYDPHHLTAARARFDDLSTSAPRDPFERIVAASPAAAALTRWKAAFDAGDWEGMRSLCAAGMVFEDRRRFMQLSGDAELMIASARERTRVGARPESSFVGTAGDRVAIGRTLWTGGPADGRFEIEYLALAEVDERGRFLAIVFFDADDIRGAQREAWARWAAIDPSVADITVQLGEVIDGWNEKDLQRLRAVFAEDIVVEDHRRTGTGRSEGREEYLRSVTALWELAPESRIDGGWFWLASAPHGGVYELRRRGTLPGGGELVSDDLVVFVSERGLVTRMELFEMDATDVALARFEELDPASLQGQPRRS
ncbi:MAG TPA: nuclear transport factor 2 family protein, partial [Candidatus Binatia bacterium]|nr:nuclear transport factor 2 family protein [Candidatus Binatia bacterium]